MNWREYSKLINNFGEELRKSPESFDFETESKKLHNAVDVLIAKIKIKGDEKKEKEITENFRSICSCLTC